jgi:hypothetical protein
MAYQRNTNQRAQSYFGPFFVHFWTVFHIFLIPSLFPEACSALKCAAFALSHLLFIILLYVGIVHVHLQRFQLN